MKNFKFAFFIILMLLKHSCIADYPITDTNGCEFPFKYRDNTYTSCISDEQIQPWCSYSKEFVGVWKFCVDMRKSDLTCVSECELYENDQYPSCSTDISNRRKYCVEQILDMSRDSSNIISDDCPSEFKAINFHTACLKPSIYAAKSGVSESDKEAILKVHNEWRKNVPVSASGMNKIYWDDELAFIAQKHADQCIHTHDDSNLRSIPKTGKQAGQNIVSITGKKYFNWEYALNTMFKAESERFEYGIGTKKEFDDFGKTALHYTQAILEKLSRVGCGYTECVFAEGLERLYVCNYDQLQMDYQIPKPYESGPPCQNCPNNCVEQKLCDCGGLDCYNSGELDLSSCTCTCRGMWTGKNCESPITESHNEHGCAIPFVYNNKLYYDCALDTEQFPIPFCFSVPEFDDVPEHFIPCDWMQSKRRYIGKIHHEKKSKNWLLEKYEQKLKRKSHDTNYMKKKWISSISSPLKHIIKKNYMKFNVI